MGGRFNCTNLNVSGRYAARGWSLSNHPQREIAKMVGGRCMLSNSKFQPVFPFPVGPLDQVGFVGSIKMRLHRTVPLMLHD